MAMIPEDVSSLIRKLAAAGWLKDATVAEKESGSSGAKMNFSIEGSIKIVALAALLKELEQRGDLNAGELRSLRFIALHSLRAKQSDQSDEGSGSRV